MLRRGPSRGFYFSSLRGGLLVAAASQTRGPRHDNMGADRRRRMISLPPHTPRLPGVAELYLAERSPLSALSAAIAQPLARMATNAAQTRSATAVSANPTCTQGSSEKKTSTNMRGSAHPDRKSSDKISMIATCLGGNVDLTTRQKAAVRNKGNASTSRMAPSSIHGSRFLVIILRPRTTNQSATEVTQLRTRPFVTGAFSDTTQSPLRVYHALVSQAPS
jgi:hypothetical protein